MADIQFDTSFLTRGAVLNAQAIGCKPFVDTTTDNAPIFTSYYADKNNRLPLDYGGERYRLKSTLTLPAWCGYGLGVNSSSCEIRGDSEFTSPSAPAGPAGGLVWDNPSLLSGPMVDYKGYGMTLNGTLWGYHNTNRSQCVPTAGQSFTSFSQYYKQIGLQIQQNQNGIGVGKIASTNLGINCFNIGIQYGTVPTGGNSDECVFGALRFFNCDIGIKQLSRDSTANTYQQLHFVECPVGYLLSGGGWITIGQVATGGPHSAVLFQVGESANAFPNETVESNNGCITIGNLRVDGTIVYDSNDPSKSYCTIIDSQKMSWAQFVIHNLQLQDNHSYTVSTRPLAIIGGAETLDIRWGSLLRDNCIKTIERQTHWPVLKISGRFYPGETPLAMIRSDSTGKCRVVIRDCYSNDAEGSTDGRFPDCDQIWNNGVLYWQRFYDTVGSAPQYPNYP